MNRILGWIRSHQGTAFFVITYAITWGLGFSYGAVLKRDQYLLAPFAFVATCGPALAGIIVSIISNTEPKQETSKASRVAFFVAWPIAALVGISFNTFINKVPLSPAIMILYLVSAVPVAFVISASKSRNSAVRNTVSSLIHIRGVWSWALATLLILPASILLAVPINNLLFEQPISIFPLPATGLPLIGLIVIRFLYQLFFFNATGEEVGWRGFALPRLQAQASPLVAAVVIGLFWAPWHFFLWQAEGRMVLTLSFWSTYLVGHILFSILLAWLYNRSRGSILVVGIAHAAANTTFAFIPFQNLNVLNLTWAIVALLLILFDRMWEKLPSDDPVVYRSHLTAA
jgi:membrane protease YdiL (CAAX protease family)